MSADSKRLRALTRRAFRASDAIGQGLLTRDQLRGKAWRRLFRGVYADARKPIDHDLFIDGASLLLPDGAAIGGRSAAHFWGAALAGPGDAVEVLTPPDRRFGPVRGLSIRTGALAPGEVFTANDIVVTEPLRTAWDLARVLDPTEAVVWLDALAGRRRISRTALLDYATTRRYEYGWHRVVRVFDLVEPRAESPQESRLRVLLILAGLPRPVAQYEVIHRGQLIARVDLAWPGARLAVEYDGRWHGESGQLGRDRRRWRALQEAGWRVHPVTAADLREPESLVIGVERALAGRAK